MMPVFLFLLVIFCCVLQDQINGQDVQCTKDNCPALAVALQRIERIESHLTDALLSVATCQSRLRMQQNERKRKIVHLENSVNMLQLCCNSTNQGLVTGASNNNGQNSLQNGCPNEEILQQRIVTLENTVKMLRNDSQCILRTNGTVTGQPGTVTSGQSGTVTNRPGTVTSPVTSIRPGSGTSQSLRTSVVLTDHFTTSVPFPSFSTLPVVTPGPSVINWQSLPTSSKITWPTQPCEGRDIIHLKQRRMIMVVCLDGFVFLFPQNLIQNIENPFLSMSTRKIAVPNAINSGIAHILNTVVDENSGKFYCTVYPWNSGIFVGNLDELIAMPGTVQLEQFIKGDGKRHFGGLALERWPGQEPLLYCADELVAKSITVWKLPARSNATKISEIAIQNPFFNFSPTRIAVFPMSRLIAVSDSLANKIILFRKESEQYFRQTGTIDNIRNPQGLSFASSGHLFVAQYESKDISVNIYFFLLFFQLLN